MQETSPLIRLFAGSHSAPLTRSSDTRRSVELKRANGQTSPDIWRVSKAHTCGGDIFEHAVLNEVTKKITRHYQNDLEQDTKV